MQQHLLHNSAMPDCLPGSQSPHCSILHLTLRTFTLYVVGNLQELNSLQQQLRGLQEELQESSQEAARLEGAATDLDGKAVQLQIELDQAHHEHQEALHHLQVRYCAFPCLCLHYALLYS